MGRLPAPGLIVILMLLLLSPLVLAEDQAKITANELTYDYHAQQMEASGNVKIIYKDITVECDHLFMDQAQNVILATGKVRIIKKDSEYTGDRFLYYLLTEQGLLSPVKTEIRDAEINGPLHMKAMESYFKGETAIEKNVSLSGCDLAKPHYHFTAKEVDYYPGDRIILRGVWYWEHEAPLFYLPIFFISLKHEDDNFDAEVGHNDYEGWFANIGYNYVFNSDSYGKVTTRLTEKASNDLGVKHYFDLSPSSRFYQQYTYIDNSKLGNPKPDYQIGYGYENWANSKLKLSTAVDDSDLSYIDLPGGLYALSQQKMDFNFKLTGQSPYPSLNLNFADNTGTKEYLEDLSSTWSYNPDPTLNINLDNRWYFEDKLDTSYLDPLNAPLIQANSFKYSGSIKKDWGWSNIYLNYDDTEIYSGDTGSNNLKPDVIYTIPKWQWPLLGEVKVTSEYLDLDKYIGTTMQDSGQRWALDIQKKPIVLWQSSQTTLNWESNFLYRDFRIDSVESGLDALTADMGLTEHFSKEFSTEFKLGYAGTIGQPNDFFNNLGDETLNGAFITNEWKWQSRTFNASLTSGYNFQNAVGEPVQLSACWTPGSGREIDFDTQYDWLTGLGLTNLRINYKPKENWQLTVNAGYDFSQNLWFNKELEALITQPLTPKWQLELIAKYDSLRDEFADAEIGLIYDWHCRKVRIHYDYVNYTYWLQLTFNLFPDEPLKFDSETQFEGMIDEMQF